MSIFRPIQHCSRCITSTSLLLINKGLNSHVLSEFIEDSLCASKNHFSEVKDSLSTEEYLSFTAKHAQAELLLRTLREASFSFEFVN